LSTDLKERELVADYGDVEMDRRGDDRLYVTRTDQTIGMSVDRLAEAAGLGLAIIDADGRLVIAGQACYNPLRFEEGGRVVVCVRAD
jgi:hypothetical protein